MSEPCKEELVNWMKSRTFDWLGAFVSDDRGTILSREDYFSSDTKTMTAQVFAEGR